VCFLYIKKAYQNIHTILAHDSTFHFAITHFLRPITLFSGAWSESYVQGLHILHTFLSTHLNLFLEIFLISVEIILPYSFPVKKKQYSCHEVYIHDRVPWFSKKYQEPWWFPTRQTPTPLLLEASSHYDLHHGVHVSMKIQGRHMNPFCPFLPQL
jgi:hypothetical protein